MVDCSFDEMFLTFFSFLREVKWEDCQTRVSHVPSRHDICMSRQCMDGREGDADVG